MPKTLKKSAVTLAATAPFRGFRGMSLNKTVTALYSGTKGVAAMLTGDFDSPVGGPCCSQDPLLKNLDEKTSNNHVMLSFILLKRSRP